MVTKRCCFPNTGLNPQLPLADNPLTTKFSQEVEMQSPMVTAEP